MASTPTFPNASGSAGVILRSDGTNFVTSTPTFANAAGTSGNVLRSDGTNFLSAQLNAADINPVAAQISLKLTAVNFNSGNTDNPITITLPTGYTRWRYNFSVINHPSTTMSTATFGLFTAAAGGGTELLSATTTVAITSTSENTNGNTQSPAGFTNASTQSFNAGTIYFRIINAQGGAATADVIVVLIPLP